MATHKSNTPDGARTPMKEDARKSGFLYPEPEPGRPPELPPLLHQPHWDHFKPPRVPRDPRTRPRARRCFYWPDLTVPALCRGFSLPFFFPPLQPRLVAQLTNGHDVVTLSVFTRVARPAVQARGHRREKNGEKTRHDPCERQAQRARATYGSPRKVAQSTTTPRAAGRHR